MIESCEQEDLWTYAYVFVSLSLSTEEYLNKSHNSEHIVYCKLHNLNTEKIALRDTSKNWSVSLFSETNIEPELTLAYFG